MNITTKKIMMGNFMSQYCQEMNQIKTFVIQDNNFVMVLANNFIHASVLDLPLTCPQT